MPIHPTAIVETSGTLDDDIHVGPYAIIQGNISLGKGCRIAAHAQLLNQVTLGNNCTVDASAVIGGDPQDIKFNRSTQSGVVIGDHNTFREHVTVHRSSVENGTTVIGSHNFLMAGAHVGHDCSIGDHNIIANNSLLGGFVTVGNRTFLGGGSVYHQFVRVGDLVIVQGISGFSLDLPPYTIACNVNELVGLNRIGLRRAGFARETVKEITEAFTICFRGNLTLSDAIQNARQQSWTSPEATAFLDFLESGSKKGICTRRSPRRSDTPAS